MNELKSSIMSSQEAQSALVGKFSGLVRNIALSYRGHGVPLRDLIQEVRVRRLRNCAPFLPVFEFIPSPGVFHTASS